MYLQMFVIPILLPTLVVKTLCDNNTDSDVIVRYSGHAEAGYLENKAFETSTLKDVIITDVAAGHIVHVTSPSTTTTTEAIPVETEGVVFIPNDAPIRKIEDQYDRRPLKQEDVMMRKTIGDVMAQNVRVETEAPHDIVFISSKNNDYIEKNTKDTELNRRESRRSNRKMKEEVKLPVKLDCTNLDCNNTIDSLCGGKQINREMKYRLFMNECYFRKVNCNFNNEINRYTLVSLDKCAKIGAHYVEKPYFFKPTRPDLPRTAKNLDMRKSFSSRRSMSVNMNGEFCSHHCPVYCPDDYDPECAISATGQKKVFMNHCKLDDNSCSFAVVWHRRPLEECIGGMKAELRQNRFFIDWMQRVGIIDRKGKLVLE